MFHMKQTAVALLVLALTPLGCGGQSRCEKARAEVKADQAVVPRTFAPTTACTSAFVYRNQAGQTYAAPFTCSTYTPNNSYLTIPAQQQARQIVLDDPGCFDPAVVASMRG